MKEKENNLQRKIKIIWKNTLIGSEIPSQTIKSNDISFQKNETIAVDMPDAILTTDTVIEKNNNSVNTTRRYINESEYQLIEELGRGGMGIVYLAQQKSLNREVALKVISTKRQQQEMQKRFISEAIITADLDHPNIVPIHALTKNIEGYTSIAMKRVHGKSWNELLHSKEDAKKLTLLDNLDIFIKVCDAVHYAHSHFIIHRDLKPENIMIGNFGEVFVMDWGIAIDISEKKRKKTIHRSEIKSPEGTPLYMAPEMVLNEVEKLGVATDVYLLGATLYEILHGHPPHKGKSIIEILYYASKESVGNIKDICLSTHYELDNIIIKCLAHDPEDRFQSVASLKNEIQNFVRHYDAARIIEIASDKLNDIEDKLDECNSEDIYLDGDQVYNGFVQALVIHPENEGAKQGAIDVTKIQANWAVKHQELNMLEIYSNRLKKIQPLPKKEIDIIEKKLTTLRNLRKNIVFSFAIIIFIITLVYSVDKWLGKYLKENEDEILQQNKIDNIWSSFRDLQRKYNLKKLFDFTEKNKNKNIDFPTSKLRKSNMLFALQMGYYDDVVLLLAEEIKYYPRIQKK